MKQKSLVLLLSFFTCTFSNIFASPDVEDANFYGEAWAAIQDAKNEEKERKEKEEQERKEKEEREKREAQKKK